MPPRFYCPLPLLLNQDLCLPKEVAHHAVRVLRLHYGDDVVVFDGAGGECLGALVDLAGQPGVHLRERLNVEREAPLRITLVQALAVADKMDWIVQKAVELGAAGVQPVEAERCVMKLAGDRAGKRMEHWRQIVVSASEQCGRSRLCEVGQLQRISQWLAQPAADERWILAPAEGTALSAMSRPSGAVSLLVGPEGGWSEKELAAAQAAGCKPVCMGPRVLRTETAGLAAIAAMMALWGDY